jgi:RNA polymerase sigma-70 factor (ECF subfamily)
MDSSRREAFEHAALPHLGSVAFLAERLFAGAAPDSDDLVQETFLRAWVAFDRFAPGTDARAWLLTIALNAFRDRMRKRGRDPIALDAVAEPAAPEPAPPEPLPPESMLDDRLARALDALPPVSRAILVLAVIEGIPRQEIARALECPEGTVRSLLSRAKADLRRRLAP